MSDKTSSDKKISYDPDILNAVIDSAPEGIVVTDASGRIIMANPVAKGLFPNPIPHAEPISSHTRLNLCYPDGTPYAPADLPLNRTALQGQAITDQELLVRMPGGRMRHLLVSTNPLADASGKNKGAVGFFRDITQRQKAQIEMQQERAELQTRVAQRTAELEASVEALEAQIIERKIIEAELRRSEEEFRRLSRRILEALEADRQLVAKELHDSIGASLAAIKFSLEEKLAQIERSSTREAVSLESILGYLVDTIKETKRIAAQLRPATLDDLGLLSTISWYIREFSLLFSHINVALKIDLAEEDIPTRQKIVFYRIIQETMNNAAKHGRPDTIRIHLAKGPDGLTLCVEDNGRGFDAQQQILSSTDPLSGYGLQGMRERAEICGGRFEVSSQIGSGTRVYVQLPAEGF
jgi:signal transduction histidine kinase